MDEQLEHERIAQVYREWHGGAALPRYGRLRPEIIGQSAARARAFAALFQRTVGLDLGGLRILDVGCGTGSFLRQLIDWGADPRKLCGTELLQDRLDAARRSTARGVRWHLGELDAIEDEGFDLVCAHTVFSSILDPARRGALAAEMRRTVRAGGWCLAFDFRYNNPRNPQVRRVTRAEMRMLWPDREYHYRSLLLAPPLARSLACLPWLLPEALATLLPPVRSHFIYMARKGG